MDFVGRHREIDALRASLSSARSELVVLYGRRRVGKTALLLEAIRGQRAVYFVGKQAPPQLQLQELMRRAAASLEQPLLAHVSPTTWAEALAAIESSVPPGEKLVLAFDEFQWMCDASPELPSVLQEAWDHRWQEGRRVCLMLCGSYVGFMEREVLGSKSPLFGRRTTQIHLQPFGPREARKFHPNYSLRDAARTWFVCGGVPLYLKYFDPARSVERNIQACLLDEYAPLFREPDFLLREELRDVQSYYAVLTALSSGSLVMADIAERSAVPNRSLPYYLNTLQELRYVRKRHPLTRKAPNARLVRFELSDPLLRFWFRFVYPNQSAIRQLGPKHAFEHFVKPDLPSWEGIAFEHLCRALLPEVYADLGVHVPFEVGEYWDKGVQVDLVSVRDDGWIDVAECKWGGVSSPKALDEEVRGKVARYPNHGGDTVAPWVFVRSVPKARAARDGSDGLPRWVGLEALYGV